MPFFLVMLLLCALAAWMLELFDATGISATVAKVLYLVFVAGSLVLLASKRRREAR